MSFLPLSLYDLKASSAELMEDPITRNTANVRSSLKIIRLPGRNGLPRIKVHLKHCGLEKAVLLWKEHFHIKSRAFCV